MTRLQAPLAALLLLGLSLGAAVAAGGADDPDLADDWYPLACGVWRGHMESRVAFFRQSGRVDEVDAAIFAAAIERVGRDCRASGRNAMRLLLTLDESLGAWQSPEPTRPAELSHDRRVERDFGTGTDVIAAAP